MSDNSRWAISATDLVIVPLLALDGVIGDGTISSPNYALDLRSFPGCRVLLAFISAFASVAWSDSFALAVEDAAFPLDDWNDAPDLAPEAIADFTEFGQVRMVALRTHKDRPLVRVRVTGSAVTAAGWIAAFAIIIGSGRTALHED